MTDPEAWRLHKHEQGAALELYGRSRYTPKVWSPHNYALIGGLTVTDFQLDVRLKSTAGDSAHRDLCLFFGFQDPEHFYYVHLGRRADPTSHSIFLVNGEPRVSIATERTSGTLWDDGWHHVRVLRSAETGEIKVYFDDMEQPDMRAIDKTFTRGRLGVGSFDDTGMFDDLEVRARRYEE